MAKTEVVDLERRIERAVTNSRDMDIVVNVFVSDLDRALEIAQMFNPLTEERTCDACGEPQWTLIGETWRINLIQERDS